MESCSPQPDQTGHDDKYGYGLLKIKNLIDVANQ